MPLVSPRLKLDFLRRQVLMSRNISGGRLMSIFMGGLNYQIEHHLFPSMARPHLRRPNRSWPPTAPIKACRIRKRVCGGPTATLSAISTPSASAARTRSYARWSPSDEPYEVRARALNWAAL